MTRALPSVRSRAQRALAAAALALALHGGSARAQSDDKTSALALFKEGRALVAAGQLDRGCRAFAVSIKLVPKVSTMLNLADCYERAGKLSSAWTIFTEAAGAATHEHQPDREKLARDRAAALEPRLAHLTIATTGAPPARLTVTRDGEAVDLMTMGNAIPIDAGKHTVEATAPHKKRWSTAVDITDGAKASVTIPLLEDDGDEPGPSAVVAPSATDRSSPGSNAPPAQAPSQAGATQRTIGLVGGVVGVAAIGAGAVFGFMAKSAKNAYEAHCGAAIGAPASFCDPEGISGHADASTKATVSTGLLVGGAAALVAGAILFFTAPRSRVTRHVGVGGEAVVVRGWF
jgi:hypothetical protein